MICGWQPPGQRWPPTPPAWTWGAWRTRCTATYRTVRAGWDGRGAGGCSGVERQQALRARPAAPYTPPARCTDCPTPGAPPTHLAAPPAVLLIAAAKAWQAEHGRLPGSQAERVAFKGLLQGWQRHVDGVPLDVSGASGSSSSRGGAWDLRVLGWAGRRGKGGSDCTRTSPNPRPSPHAPPPPPHTHTHTHTRRRTLARPSPTLTRCGPPLAPPPSCARCWRMSHPPTSPPRHAGDGAGGGGGQGGLCSWGLLARSGGGWGWGGTGARADPHSPPPPPMRQSPDFWVLVAALRRFIEQEGGGLLPLEVRASGCRGGDGGGGSRGRGAGGALVPLKLFSAPLLPFLLPFLAFFLPCPPHSPSLSLMPSLLFSSPAPLTPPHSTHPRTYCRAPSLTCTPPRSCTSTCSDCTATRRSRTRQQARARREGLPLPRLQQRRRRWAC